MHSRRGECDGDRCEWAEGVNGEEHSKRSSSLDLRLPTVSIQTPSKPRLGYAVGLLISRSVRELLLSPDLRDWLREDWSRAEPAT
jgi:hypothetical protein